MSIEGLKSAGFNASVQVTLPYSLLLITDFLVKPYKILTFNVTNVHRYYDSFIW